MPLRRFVVLATGTGIGKTYVTAALARALRTAGVKVAALKPVESGIDAETLGTSDAAVLAAASGGPVLHCYALKDPVSPHLAARRAGVSLDPSRVNDFVTTHDALATVSLIESAGGAFSPLGGGQTNADLARNLSQVEPTPIEVLLIAPDRLGVLHEVHSTLVALGVGGGPRVRAVLLSAPEVEDASTGTNAAELEAVVFPELGSSAPLEPKVMVVPRGGDCELFVSRVLLPLLR